MVDRIKANGSEHTLEFEKPCTVAALELVSPRLILAYNRRHNTFQVLERVRHVYRYYIPGFGDLAVMDYRDEHVVDWQLGLEGGHDNPAPLLLWLKDHDRLENPDRFDDDKAVERCLAYRAQIEEKVRDNWKHAVADNKRQMRRAWQPFMDFPAFVR